MCVHEQLGKRNVRAQKQQVKRTVHVKKEEEKKEEKKKKRKKLSVQFVPMNSEVIVQYASTNNWASVLFVPTDNRISVPLLEPKTYGASVQFVSINNGGKRTFRSHIQLGKRNIRTQQTTGLAYSPCEISLSCKVFGTT